MHIIIQKNGLYFTGKVSELRLLLTNLTVIPLKFATFLKQNLQ